MQSDGLHFYASFVSFPILEPSSPVKSTDFLNTFGQKVEEIHPFLNWSPSFI